MDNGKVKKTYIQILTYIRRRQDLTLAQFYNHWENEHAPKIVPWAQKHGIIRYQQMHVTGSMVPKPLTDLATNYLNTGDLPTTPVEFDGVAIFVVSSLEQFKEAFNDPYYMEVIEPDERLMIDEEGPGAGIIASFQGEILDIII